MALEPIRLPAADRDLDEIWLHIAQDSIGSANRLVGRIDEAELRLAQFPELGRARPDIRQGLRHWPVGDYLLLYRVEPPRLVTVRIVHGARDLPGLFDEET